MAFAPEELVERLTAVLGDKALSVRHVLGQVVVEVAADHWVAAIRALKDDVELDLDYFCFLSAIDWISTPTEVQKVAAAGGGATPGGTFESREGADGYLAPEGDLIQVICRLASATQGHGVTLRVDLDHESPELATLTGIYGGADWHERECSEMFGVTFPGHPNPKKIYLPDHFEGNPLRKSFVLGSRLVKPWPGHVDVEELPASMLPEAPSPAEPTPAEPAAEAAAATPEPAPEPVLEEPQPEAKAEAKPEAEAQPEPEPAAPESIEAESMRTGIPIAVLEHSRAARESSRESPPDIGADLDQAALEAESQRTGIPVSILKRTWESRKRAGGKQ